MLVIAFSQVPVFATELDDSSEEVTTQQEATVDDSGDSVTSEDETVIDDESSDSEEESIEDAQEPVKARGAAKSPDGSKSSASDLFAGGSGTIDDPYQIETVEQLDYVRNDLNSHYVLNNNISFNNADFSQDGQFYNEGEGWNPIGDESNPFVGTFDGQQYAIEGLTITSDNQYNGLFGYASGASVQNLTIKANYNVATKTTSAYVGGVIGYANDCAVTSCSFDGQLSSRLLSSTTAKVPHYVGGIVGYLDSGSISDCYSSGAITPNATCGSFGGIVGFSNGSINNCENTANVSSNCNNEVDGNVDSLTFYGGIAGTASLINDCINKGEIRARGAAAGICGKTAGTCSGCNNEGNVTVTTQTQTYGGAKVFAGGIVAKGGTCNNCQNSGTISAKSYNRDSNAGGIAGTCTVNNSVNRGSVVSNHPSSNTGGYTYAGGITAQGKATLCENYGNVTAYAPSDSYNYAGGILGYGGSVDKSSNHSSVVGDGGRYAYIGGVVGYYSQVTESYNEGHIYGKYAGGISGFASKSIANCYNFGRITGSTYAGGICGSNKSTITNVYNAGNVNNLSGSGIAGYNSGTIQSAYYLDNLPNGVGNDEYVGEKLSSNQMMKAASFSGFDFESTWNINENSTFSYPTLRNVINSEGQSSNSIIDAGHTWDSKYTIDKQPTCSEKGSGLIYCLECGDYKEVEIPIDPNAHSWGDWTETTPATCATGGVETRTCKHDATHTETRNTDPKQDAHDWDEWTKINDEQHQRVCRNDANHKETGDHSWDEGVETTPASETEDGVKTYTCNVCGATKTEDIPSQLVLAKQDALARLKQVNLNNYSGVERTKVENALKTAIEAIENATSVSEVTDAENAANGTIKAQKTDAQKAAEAKPNTKPEVVDLKAVKSLKVKGAKGKLTVKWKKAAKKELKTFQYYEIQYTLNGTFKDYPPKTVGKKKASVTVKKLLKKKKYTVRIRRCRDDGSVLHVSPWKVKKAKTK